MSVFSSCAFTSQLHFQSIDSILRIQTSFQSRFSPVFIFLYSWNRHNSILCGFSAGHKCRPQVLAWWRTGEGAGGTLACRWCCGLFASIAILPHSQWHVGPTQLLALGSIGVELVVLICIGFPILLTRLTQDGRAVLM